MEFIAAAEWTFSGSAMRNELYSKEHQKLREVLKRERIAAGLRQSDLAERTNRSQAFISKFETGDLRIDVVDFVRLCETIGCNPHDILDETFARLLSARTNEA